MQRPLFTSLLTAAVLTCAASPFLSFTPRAVAAPQPSVVPVAWQLNIKHGPVERLILTVDGKQKAYWYMRYSVVNNTGKDILFTPEIELITDTGQAQEAYKDVPREVFKKIKELYNNPLLESPTNILGKLLQGADNAKDGVIIFADVDKGSRDFQILISGLSGETAEVKNPITHKSTILQKTLVLDYVVPGQAIGIAPEPQYKGSHWVMK